MWAGESKNYLLLCETVSGAEAERIGLVSRVVDTDQLQAEGLNIAHRLAAGSQSELAGTKRSLNHWLHAAWPAFEASLTAEMMDFSQRDAREGVKATKEKRTPVFGKATSRYSQIGSNTCFNFPSSRSQRSVLSAA